jgi:hypothetical protein
VRSGVSGGAGKAPIITLDLMLRVLAVLRPLLVTSSITGFASRTITLASSLCSTTLSMIFFTTFFIRPLSKFTTASPLTCLDFYF